MNYCIYHRKDEEKREQEAQRACIIHLSFNEKHTSSLKKCYL